MKNFGSNSEYNAERTRDLLRAYFQYIHSCRHVAMPDVFKNVVEMPAERFWVSASRAVIVVAKIIRGDSLNYMRKNKREMFFEIHRRIIRLRRRHPRWSLAKLAEIVTEQPAPKFYLAPGSARVIILKARKKWFAEQQKKLLGC